MSKSISQRSLRIGLSAIAVILISSFAFASAWSNSFGWLGFATASAENTEQTVEEPSSPNIVLVAGVCNDVLPANSNIEVEATNSANNLGYTTLGAAFTAINAGTHTGVITIDVCADTSEGAVTALSARLAIATAFKINAKIFVSVVLPKPGMVASE